MTAISVHNLHKHYGQLHVLRGLTLEITQGECVILLGANGCGKSTLMRCLNGLTSHDQGEITILGDSLTGLSKPTLRQLRRKVGVVFQQFNLVQNVSVFHKRALWRHGTATFWLALLALLPCHS